MFRIRAFLRSYTLPAVVLLLGVSSAALVMGIQRMNLSHQRAMALEDAVEDAELMVVKTHSGLEEVIASDSKKDFDPLWQEIDRATSLLDGMLTGGVTTYGASFEPLGEGALRNDVEDLKAKLALYAESAHERVANPSGEADAAREFHARLIQFDRAATAVREAVERRQLANLARSRRLFWAIMTAWAGLIMASVGGIFVRERRRRKAEVALREANERLQTQAAELEKHREHLKELVEERTAELTGAQQRLVHLSSRLLTAQEVERRRISKEIHDELGGTLAAAKMGLSHAQKGLTADQTAARTGCDCAREALDRAIDGVYRLSRNLSPYVLEDLGLSGALRWLFDSFNRHLPDLHATLEDADIDDLFAHDAQVVFYRIVQEALANVAKHSGARNVSMMIRREDGAVTLVVEDDGRGFDAHQALEEAPGERGMGMRTMDERARMLGGRLEVWSRPGKGTRLTFTIPVPEEGV